MLQAQGSLAESVDGDELRSDDGFQGERPCLNYYCLYLYQAGSLSQPLAAADAESLVSVVGEASSEDFSLSPVDTNLPSELEPELRGFVAKWLSRGTFFEGVGIVSAVELSSFPEYSLGCYHCLLRQDQACESSAPSPEYVVCFLGGSEKGLDLFRLELDNYAATLKTKLSLQMTNLEAEIKPLLGSWYADTVLPIYRVVTLFQEKVAYLLHAALSYTPVEVKNADPTTQNDIKGFQSLASLQGLVQDDTMSSLCIVMTEELQKQVYVDFSDSQPQLVNAVSNKFCEDWMQVFINCYDGGNPFLFRQKLENFKLKVIQDMNNLKRLIRQAEMSHYALFRCYTFLKNCGNGDILLKIVKVEHAEMPESGSVVSVLEEFIREEGSSVHHS
uniref:Chromosome 17 open reading frame 75 n=1 Tax=Leptobrachium leishanense TaxID=445787 RepID=A0A8C5R357_9ANUR